MRPAAALLAAALAFAQPASAQSLKVTGLDGAAKTLAPADLAGLPRAKASLTEDGKAHAYEGPRLSDVLRQAGLPMGQRLHGDPLRAYLVVAGSDGFEAVYALAEVDRDFHHDTVILADRVDGKPLPQKQAPWRVVSSGDRKSWRAVYAVATIEARVLPKAGMEADHAGH